jgi:uncharacterized protein YndB with AHSA1/START domain
MQGEQRVQVRTRVPAEDVFALLTDWARQRDWMPFTRAEGGSGVGAQVRAWTGVGPLGFWDTMEITEWEPGRRVATRHTGFLVRGTAWFETEPLASGGSTIVWVERLAPPFGIVGKVVWPLVGPGLRSFMLVGLRRLVRLAEREAG